MEALNPALTHRLLDEHAFAVIDPLCVESLPQELPTIPVALPSLVDEAHLLPVLVPLNELDSRAKTELLVGLEQAQQTAAAPVTCMLLQTDADPERMRQHAAARTVLPVKTLGNVWLRWHDPRVLVQLRWMLRAELLRTLYGPVQACTLYHQGAWYCAAAPESGFATWAATADEAVHLQNIGLVNATLGQLGPIERIADLEPLSRRIHTLLQRARLAHGLWHEDDLLVFALQGMTVHAAFDGHPLIRPLLQHCTRDDTYADRSAALEHATWQRVAAELNAGQPAHPTEQIRHP